MHVTGLLHYRLRTYLVLGAVFTGASLALFSAHASAQPALITTENPKANSFGMEGKIPTPPPGQGARITAPSGGQTYTSSPITVSGVCVTGLLVEIVNNGVMSGSTMCENGSFSLQVSLFPGQNDLRARVLDELGQEGPASNTVTVTFNNAQSLEFGSTITLTSSYSRRAADPGSTMTWPLQLSGGRGPYAFSINWGDGSVQQLLSQPTPGAVTISHVYKNPGIYRVTIRVTDVGGVTGFLQVIAVANGAADAAIKDGKEQAADAIVHTEVMWAPSAAMVGLLFPAFWLGRRYEMRAFRRRLERDAEMVRRLNA